MTLPAPIYDLVLLLDTQSEEDARAKIVADARAAIEAQGELLRHDDWGERALTYPIERKANAVYHLLQFHAGESELLGGLERTLRITDGVVRFRIIKLAPGVPQAPDMGSSATRRPDAEGESPAPAPSAAAPASQTPPASPPPAASPAPAAPSEPPVEASAEAQEDVAVSDPA